MDIKADVSKMYSSFSRFFVIETIDVFLLSVSFPMCPIALNISKPNVVVVVVYYYERMREVIMPWYARYYYRGHVANVCEILLSWPCPLLHRSPFSLEFSLEFSILTSNLAL